MKEESASMTMNGETAHVALVTGAARGIGLGISRQLGRDGFRVVMADILDDVNESVDMLRRDGIDAHAIKLDVADEHSIVSVAREVSERFGDVQVLANNAGISPKHNGYKLPLTETSLSEWELVMRVNLTGPLLLSRELIPGLKRAARGRIINTVSVTARYASPVSGGPYNASKVGLIALSRVMALELAGTSVTVNCVAPGRIITPLSRQYDPSVDREYVKNVPAQRLGYPEDIANAVGFLASANADGITGTVVDVNGGTFCN